MQPRRLHSPAAHTRGTRGQERHAWQLHSPGAADRAAVPARQPVVTSPFGPRTVSSELSHGQRYAEAGVVSAGSSGVRLQFAAQGSWGDGTADARASLGGLLSSVGSMSSDGTDGDSPHQRAFASHSSAGAVGVTALNERAWLEGQVNSSKLGQTPQERLELEYGVKILSRLNQADAEAATRVEAQRTIANFDAELKLAQELVQHREVELKVALGENRKLHDERERVAQEHAHRAQVAAAQLEEAEAAAATVGQQLAEARAQGDQLGAELRREKEQTRELEARIAELEAAAAAARLKNRELHMNAMSQKAKALIDEQLLDVTKAFSGELDQQTLMMTIIEKTRTVLDADRCALFMVDEARDQMWASLSDGTIIRIGRRAGIVGWVASNNQPLNITDAYADARFNTDVDKETGYRTTSILAVPVHDADEKLIGVIQMINKTGGPFGEDDLDMLQMIASQAGVTLTNAAIFDEVKKDQEMSKKLEMSIKTLKASELNIQKLIQSIMDSAKGLLDCDRSTLFLADDQKNELYSYTADGVGTEIRLPITAGIAGAVATSNQVINIADAYEDSRFNQGFDRKTGYRTTSILCVPVMSSKGRLLGVCQMINKGGGGERDHPVTPDLFFEKDDESQLGTFMSQAAVSIENALQHRQEMQHRENQHEEMQQQEEKHRQEMEQQLWDTGAQERAARQTQADLQRKVEEIPRLEARLQEADARDSARDAAETRRCSEVQELRRTLSDVESQRDALAFTQTAAKEQARVLSQQLGEESARRIAEVGQLEDEHHATVFQFKTGLSRMDERAERERSEEAAAAERARVQKKIDSEMARSEAAARAKEMFDRARRDAGLPASPYR